MSLARFVPTASLVTFVLAGCAANPSPVPVSAEPNAIAALAGEWTGEYSSAATGRRGSIVFTLAAGSDTAYGDVAMVPSGSDQPLRAAGTSSGAAGGQNNVVTRPAAQGLTIRFVRIAGDSVSGVLDPYTAPDCGCVLTTTFRGRVQGGRIEGTFESSGDPRAAGSQGGHWAVTRRQR